MTQQWKFTVLEFIVLCERHRQGLLPKPFWVESDEVVYADALEQRKRAAWEELRRRLEGSFDGAIEVLCAPELYLEVSSWDEQNSRNWNKEHRLYAARAGALAYVFEQAPGPLIYDTVAFTVTECDPRRLAVAVVDALPRVEAGRLPGIPIVTDRAEDIAPTWGGSFVRDNREDTLVYQTQRFFQRRSDCTGSIQVVQGRSKYGPRGIQKTTMLWRDVAGDGRYVMSLDEPPFAVGTNRRMLIERIQTDIDTMMQRLETHWEIGRPEDRY
ncbi:ESX secretion-associated protein EspG [Nocardia sp. NPDC051570]|uniref:ESX secretion-associated protein EspG n=1 Tax=Nocardia sp. NPDC051570 TaxID=3364324 RepID=UPI003789DFDC